MVTNNLLQLQGYCQSIEASAVKQTWPLVSFCMRVLRSMTFATHVYFQCLALFEHVEKLRYSAMPYSVLVEGYQ